MSESGHTGVRRIVHATINSVRGFGFAWRHESAFRQELTLTILLVPAAFWLGTTAVEIALLIGSCLFVLSVELLNSAVEATVDRVGTEHHELSGRAKDLGSAAVFVSLVLVAVIWTGVAWQRFLG